MYDPSMISSVPLLSSSSSTSKPITATMQQPHSLTEANTAPRLVAGQFEDADDDTEVEIVAATTTTNTGPMVCKSTPSSQKIIATPTPFKSASSHHPLKTQSSSSLKIKTVPPPSRLQLERRISSSTTEATKALLAIAASAPPQQRRKKKTFVVRLEEIKEYKERHNGRCPPRRDPLPTDQPWEQSLLAWIQDCRRQFAEGSFSQEKAQALRGLGCEGFAARLVKPQAQNHPALQALWFQRQQQQAEEEARMMALRRARMDPDGRHDDVMHAEEAAMLRSQRLAALEELQMREQLMAQREAMMREQFVREQRMQQALQAQRRMSQGAMGAAGFGLAAAQAQQGRVMSLLQPLDAVPSRADLAMSAAGGAFGATNARMNALLMMQQEQQRRASLVAAAQQQAQQESALLRRPSDASGATGERRPSGVTSSSNEAQPRVRKTWDERMKEMWRFFLSHGHTQVQTRGEDRELGRWLSNTRCRLRDGLLPQHLAKEFLAMERWNLEDGGPKAAMEEEAARRRFSASGVPGEVTVLATPPTQSKVKNFGIATAGVTSPKGKTKRALPKSWHQSFTELQQFKAKFGHCDVKMIVNSPYGLLGKWLASQRSRHKLGQLPLDKVNRLREVGCNGFPETGGKGSVNRSHYRKDDEEAEFDQALRRLKKGNEGDEDADEGMDDAPCSPATREKRVRHSYETRVEHIKAFREKHGHVKIRLGSSDKHEELLARWLASARSRYRGGQFKEERAAELRALGCDGFETNGQYNDGNSTTSCMDEESESRKRVSPARTATPSPVPSHLDEHEDDEDCNEPPSKKQRGGGKRQSFEDMLKELEQYQYVFGVGCSVPKPDGEKGKLGRWLAFQRRQFIAGKLSDERIEKLQVIGRKEFNKSALIVRAAERAAASIHIDQ